MSKHILLLLFVLLTIAAQAGAKISYLVGNVSYTRGGNSYTAAQGAVLQNGDTVSTGDRSKVEITFEDGSVARLSSNSSLTVSRAESSGGSTNTILACFGGRLWSTVTPFSSSDSSYVVKTPTATAAVRGTVFRANVGCDTSTVLRVYDGEVEVSQATLAAGDSNASAFGTPPEDWAGTAERYEVTGPHEVEGPHEVTEAEWAHIIMNMQQIIVNADGSTWIGSFSDSDDSSEWEWVLWNRERDAALGR